MEGLPKSNGIDPPVSLYELRHTFVSMVQDLPDSKLKPLVGHSRSMDTRGVYAHGVDGAQDETANELTALSTGFRCGSITHFITHFSFLRAECRGAIPNEKTPETGLLVG